MDSTWVAFVIYGDVCVPDYMYTVKHSYSLRLDPMSDQCPAYSNQFVSMLIAVD